MFENLVERFDSVFSNLKKTGSIDEKSLDEAMRSIRRALLEADVSLPVVKNFIENVKNKAIGQNIIDSVSPAQMIIKIVNDELTETLGSGKSELNLVGANPKKIMFIGLQGSGKTTSVVKLAKYIKDKNSQNILLVSLDVNRPAAFEQLQILGNKINIKTLSRIDKQNPIEIIKRSEQEALKTKIDFILYDTAGRINIDNNLLQELKIIENEIKPTETLLVLDSLTGQEAMTAVSYTHLRAHET